MWRTLQSMNQVQWFQCVPWSSCLMPSRFPVVQTLGNTVKQCCHIYQSSSSWTSVGTWAYHDDHELNQSKDFLTTSQKQEAIAALEAKEQGVHWHIGIEGLVQKYLHVHVWGEKTRWTNPFPRGYVFTPSDWHVSPLFSIRGNYIWNVKL